MWKHTHAGRNAQQTRHCPYKAASSRVTPPPFLLLYTWLSEGVQKQTNVDKNNAYNLGYFNCNEFRAIIDEYISEKEKLKVKIVLKAVSLLKSLECTLQTD